ncbi:unnamed protein product [Bursaphelenchus okinawaensis]|uniref:Uncharacterized protein n=1 Tax=Bursaphelenchus okinawaensis TaxID=465554 RepID=A0A811JS94_9BILA|nr:unnamed protein product [Bursaphelenchus okinawaensis]CAG9080252.1 unnamed protein product [Bursaphelenchus okinawaensis]
MLNVEDRFNIDAFGSTNRRNQKNESDSSKFRSRDNKSRKPEAHSYTFDVFLKRIESDQRRETVSRPTANNNIVMSQAWSPQLPCSPTAVHKYQDELEELFADQLTQVVGIPRVAKYGIFKFYFFDVRDVGEPIRMMFHYVNEPFEDIRVKDSDWLAKYKSELKSLPMLDHNGFVLHKALPIAKYVADIFGLVGKDRKENAVIDEFMEIHFEAMNDFQSFLKVLSEKDEHDKKQFIEEMGIPLVKRYFSVYSTAVLRENSSFLVGTSPTFADFYATDLLDRLYTTAPSLFDGYADLVGYFKGIIGMKDFAEYLQQRKNFSI